MSESSDDDIGPRPPSKRPHVIESDSEDDLATLVPLPGSTKKIESQPDFPPNIPSGQLYEKSYMHRETVTHVYVSIETGFLISISSGDGVIKFWKKQVDSIEFVKSFPTGSVVLDSAVSTNQRELAAVTKDGFLRLFDIETFTLYSLIKLSDTIPTAKRICYVSGPASPSNLLALASSKTGAVYVLDSAALADAPKQYKPKLFSIHEAVVDNIGYSSTLDLVVSIGSDGCIEIWNPSTFESPIESKFDSDLFELQTRDETAVSLAVSNHSFAILTNSGFIKVFRISDGKMTKSLDETLDTLMVAQNDPLQQMVHIEPQDLAERLPEEGLIPNSFHHRIVFDDAGEYLIWTCVVGVKIFHVKTNRLIAVLGRIESSERFLNIALYQDKGQVRIKSTTGETEGGIAEFDPTIIASSYQSNRFYLFTNRMPGEDRDVFNEIV